MHNQGKPMKNNDLKKTDGRDGHSIEHGTGGARPKTAMKIKYFIIRSNI